MMHFDTNSFDKAMSSDQLVMVDFWASWCGPCRMLGPVIEELADQYDGKAIIGKANVDEQPELAARFGIQTIPTVIFFKNGQEIDRKIGVMPADAYTEILDNN